MKKILLVIFVGGILMMRYFWYEKTHTSNIPEGWFNNKTEIVGVVTEDPDLGIEKTKIILGNLGILATLPSGVEVSYGDQVSVFGKVTHPENFITDTNREFDYKNYLKAKGIYGLVRANDVKIILHHQGGWWREKLFGIKRYFVRSVQNLFPQEEAGLFAGIMVGEKSLLSKEVLEDFQTAGLTHIIVLSGHNITLVVIVVTFFFAWLGFGYRARRLGAIVVIPLFLVMTGLGASSVRAGIMTVIALVLQITTRPPHVFRIILYTVSIIGWVNPRILLYDPGFHLSLIAFVGLVYIAPIAKERVKQIPEFFGLSSLVIETISVQLFVLPYILWMSGEVSLLILVSNILVVPIIPFIMSGGFAATLTSIISYPLGWFIAWPIQKLLSYCIWIAHMIGSASQAVVTIPPFGGWVIILIYSVMMVYLIRHH